MWHKMAGLMISGRLDEKKKYFYYDCDTVHGKHVIGIEVTDTTLGEMIDAEEDLKRIILEPAESMINSRPRKPRGMDWEMFRKPWAIIGTKKEKATA